MAGRNDDAEMNRFASQYGGMGAYRYKREQRKERVDRGNSILGDAVKALSSVFTRKGWREAAITYVPGYKPPKGHNRD